MHNPPTSIQVDTPLTVSTALYLTGLFFSSFSSFLPPFLFQSIHNTMGLLSYDHSQCLKQVLSLLTCDVAYIISRDPHSPPPISPLNRPFPPPHSSFLLRLFTPHYWLLSHDRLLSGKYALRLLVCGVTLMPSLPSPPPPLFPARIRPLVLSFPPPRRPFQALLHPKMTSPKSVVLTTVHVAPAQAALQAA